MLVSEELAFMADFVEQHGIGRRVSRADLEHLGPVLARNNYAKLLQAVASAQDRFHIEAFIPSIERFLALR